MKKKIVCLLWLSLSLVPQPLFAQDIRVKFSDILPQLENILMDLSSNIDQVEKI
jgi:hypothetical protein